MTDRPEGETNKARWGLYSPKAAMDRDILILVTGAYVGPAGEGSSVSEEEGSFYDNAIVGGNPLVANLDDIEQNPDREYLEEWYSDPANDGYGFF